MLDRIELLTLLSVVSLQTHSAYMLFYKRVELEDDNGKDFSFNVSPDLLEVKERRSLWDLMLGKVDSEYCRRVFVHQEGVPPSGAHIHGTRLWLLNQIILWNRYEY